MTQGAEGFYLLGNIIKTFLSDFQLNAKLQTTISIPTAWEWMGKRFQRCLEGEYIFCSDE